jgi:hypothetical protein
LLTLKRDYGVDVIVWVVLLVAFYLLFKYFLKKRGPLLEVVNNVFLYAGLILSSVIFWQIFRETGHDAFGGLSSLLACGPVVVLFLLAIIERHQLFVKETLPHLHVSNTFIDGVSKKILSARIWVKWPVFIVFIWPIWLLVTSILLLFGQQPDSLVRAFTDTYYHGFSTMERECYNVICGGHFLCSVAANGHQGIVKPLRYGERLNAPIVCNRQLLVSNAFEEWLQERFPRVHGVIRKQYNKVGNQIHRHYHIFNRKWVSDVVYVMMKPAECIFILVLYLFDPKPENRIHIQYTSRKK